MNYPTIGLPQASAEIKGEKFAVRAGAYIIDLLFCYLISYPVGVISGLFLGIALTILNRPFPLIPNQRSFVDYALTLLASTSYFIILESIYGATIGKYILGMRVIMVNGEHCTFTAAIVRGLLRYIDGLFFCIPAISAMKPPLYQRIGDNAAHTMVVSSKSPAIIDPRPWWWLLIALGFFFLVDMGLVILIILSY
jgi:uncharacterized RDD family membrane protein YckC